MVSIATENARRLNRLVNDILDMERIASGHPVRESAPCDAACVVIEAVESVQMLAEDADVGIVTAGADGTAYGDAERLVQALTNLLSKQSSFRRRARRSWWRRPGAAGVTFDVSDRGRGIPPDQLDTIFEPSEQVDASDAREQGGHGTRAGAICKSIVELHNGQMWVDSTLGEGSTFSFTIAPPPCQL